MTRTLRSSGPVAVDVSSYLEEDEDVDGDRQVEEVEEEEGEPSIEWKCDVATCGKIFHRKSRLARHRVTHIGLVCLISVCKTTSQALTLSMDSDSINAQLVARTTVDESISLATC